MEMCRWKPETLRLHPWQRAAHLNFSHAVLPAGLVHWRPSNVDAAPATQTIKKGKGQKRKRGSRVGGSRAAYLETLFSPGSAALGSVVDLHSVCQRCRSIGFFAVGLRSHRALLLRSGRRVTDVAAQSRSSGRPGWPTISSDEGGFVVRSPYHWSWHQHFFQRPHKMNGRAQRPGHLTWGMCPFRSARCLSDRKAKCSSASLPVTGKK